MSYQTYVYFAEIPKMRVVKIGWARDPESRVLSIQSQFPYDLKLIGYVEGNRRHEYALHVRLAQHWMRGEWFEMNPTVEKYIRFILKTGKFPSHKPGSLLPSRKRATRRRRYEHTQEQRP
jgi:hypothetical protein